jgi:hypothetical protein
VLAQCDTKPAPGGACTIPGRYICSDVRTALYCSGGRYEPIPCKGPKGCTGGTSAPDCDDELADVGDPCMMPANLNYACGFDHKSELVCKDGKFVLARQCKGPGACRINGALLDCDNTIADVNDPCTAGSFACSTDRMTMYRCDVDKFASDNSCRGPKHCTIKARGSKQVADCDDSIAEEGDDCNKNGEVTCSSDGKSELVCQTYKYVKKQDCKRKGGCGPGEDGSLRCAF